MARIDRLKAEIAYHEKLFIASFTVFIGLISWGFEHYQTIDLWILAVIVLVTFATFGFVLWNHMQIKKLLEALENNE